ncbi:MAG: hypothetical protein ACK2UO_08400 [Caldilineaceae bacterium]|jgi:hypothetical protein
MTIVGAGSILLGLLLLLGVLFAYDPTGVTGRLGTNLFVLAIFLIGFWGLGAGLLYSVYKLGKSSKAN